MGRNLMIESGDRANFYAQAKQRGNNLNAPGMRRAELEFQASGGNQWAKNQLRQEDQDKMKVEDGNRLQAEADADFAGACADGANFVGDQVAGGAQRNLIDSYDAAARGDYRDAAGQLTKAGGKVLFQACTSKLGDAAKGLGTLAKGANVSARGAKVLQAGSKTLHAAEKLHKSQEVGGVLENGATNIAANTSPLHSGVPFNAGLSRGTAYHNLQKMQAHAHVHSVNHKA